MVGSVRCAVACSSFGATGGTGGSRVAVRSESSSVRSPTITILAPEAIGPRPSGGVWENHLSFATGDLDDRARLILNPLTNATRDRLDAAVCVCRHAPQQFHVRPGNPIVETARNYDHVDVAPVVGVAAGVRSNQDGLAHVERMFPSQHVHVSPDGAYYSCISH